MKIACPHCPDTFSKPYNLKRHIDRVHVSINKTKLDVSPGQCICQSCSFKCHRITDLRKHLSEEHNKIFHEENMTFENYPGEKLVHCITQAQQSKAYQHCRDGFGNGSECIRPLGLCF